MSPEHWSRARADLNQEALDYYRARSTAPGVAAGGSARNFYCMECDGVIPHEPVVERCPHCGASLVEMAKRYFNWVEINEPPASDLRALLPIALVLSVVLAGALFLAWKWMHA